MRTFCASLLTAPIPLGNQAVAASQSHLQVSIRCLEHPGAYARARPRLLALGSIASNRSATRRWSAVDSLFGRSSGRCRRIDVQSKPSTHPRITSGKSTTFGSSRGRPLTHNSGSCPSLRSPQPCSVAALSIPFHSSRSRVSHESITSSASPPACVVSCYPCSHEGQLNSVPGGAYSCTFVPSACRSRISNTRTCLPSIAARHSTATPVLNSAPAISI
ncbi:hypothetical protein C8T65DRAFT_206323 [Cerioporus squamosus]|nr:hypothetical protein C8T65DRAFT_206323 [Cerioporus squamosus]